MSIQQLSGLDANFLAIESDRKFLAAFSPERDRAAFEREWQARQSGARAEINAFEPNYEGSPIACGPPGGTSSALGSHAFTARAGHHLSPHRLPSGRNVFEELGSGLTLLHFNADSTICTAFKTAAQAHGIVEVGMKGVVAADAEDESPQELGELERSAVLR